MTDRTAGWVRRYDFRLGDRPAGQVVEVEQANRLTAAAWFVIDGEVVDNRYRVELAGGRPQRACKDGGPWHEIPDGVYPSSAYMLVLREGLASWRCLDEGTGEVAERRMEARHDGVVEVDAITGQALRRFRVVDGEVVGIDWGGGEAYSELLEVEAIEAP